MYEKEVTSAWNPSNRKFLREKRKSSLKFKAKNWDIGREELNNYRCKFVLLCKSKLRKKKYNQEMCYRGEKKHVEKREERQLEREIYQRRRD